MNVVPLATALGAEVRGIDLAQPLDDARQLRAWWLEHQVLLFRDQRLTPQQLIEFSRRFGELEVHDNYQPELRHPQHPELLVVRTRRVDGRRVAFGQQWHADLTYTLRPATGSCLYCIALPEVGGDTLFANLALAWEALTPTMQRLLDGLEAVHDITHGNSFRDASAQQIEAARRRNPPVVQPVVRTHPETGRKSLFVSEWMCSRIDVMTEAEGRGLIRFLCAHSVREEFTFRQRWRVGDVLLWDNRSTVHKALADYSDDERRELLRTSIAGNPQGRPLAAAA